MMPEPETEMLALVEASPVAQELAVTATPGDKFGVVIAIRGRQVGVWSWREEALAFRTLASWEPTVTAPDAAAALAATLGLVDQL